MSLERVGGFGCGFLDRGDSLGCGFVYGKVIDGVICEIVVRN